MLFGGGGELEWHFSLIELMQCTFLTVEGDEASSWSWRALHLQQLPSSSTSEWAHCHQIWKLTGGTSYLAPDLWMGETEYSEIVTNNILSVSW